MHGKTTSTEKEGKNWQKKSEKLLQIKWKFSLLSHCFPTLPEPTKNLYSL
jgi:hypothetical protein